MNIDLSKAKIGDKFRTRCGRILEYIGNDSYDIDNKYLLKDENGRQCNFYKHGNYITYGEDDLDLVEQVIDKPLDELIEGGTKQIKENDDAIAEENELKRRQEVVELAEKMLLSESMHKLCITYLRGEQYNGSERATSFHAYFLKAAEVFIDYKNEYLKNGSYGNKHLCKD